MILLVRCSNNTCSVALKSRLTDLVNEGLVTAYLRNGEWVEVEKSTVRRACKTQKQSTSMLAPLASPL